MRRLRIPLAASAFALSVGLASAASYGSAPAPRRAEPARARSADGAPPRPNGPVQPGEIEDEEYAVYSALIKYMSEDAGTKRLLVIEEQTSPWVGFPEDDPDKFYRELKESAPALSAEVIDDFRARNKGEHTLARRFDIGREYVLVGEKELNKIFKEAGGGWKAFYKKYPGAGGYLVLSRVGFNADRTQALVYQGHSCGGLCGAGSHMLLNKKNGAWVVEGSIGPSWVS